MFQKFSLIVSLLIFNLCIFAQTEPTTAPIVWQKYKISEQRIALIFPKLPVFYSRKNVCREEIYDRYAVYADGVIYGFNVTSKIKGVSFSDCTNKINFGEINFINRIKELKVDLETTDVLTIKQNNFE